jgi:hypothetical protein
MTPTRDKIASLETPIVRESADQLVPQSVVDVALQRVRLPGLYSAPHAQAVVAQAPEEITAVQVGIEPSGVGVFVLFWIPSERAPSGPDFGSGYRLTN